MKKILLILIFVFMAAPVYALTSAIQGVVTGGGAVGAGTCQATPFYDSTGTVEAFHFNAGYTSTEYSAGYQNYNPASNKSVCKIEFVLSCPNAGCASYSYYAAVYTMNGTALDVLQGAASDAVTGSNSWDATTVAFNFSTRPSVANGTNYGLVVYNNTQGESQAVKVKLKAEGGTYSAQWTSSKTRNDVVADLVAQVKIYAFE